MVLLEEFLRKVSPEIRTHVYIISDKKVMLTFIGINTFYQFRPQVQFPSAASVVLPLSCSGVKTP